MGGQAGMGGAGQAVADGAAYRRAEFRFRRRDPQIAGKGDVQAASNREALDGGDGDLRQLFESGAVAIHLVLVGDALRAVLEHAVALGGSSISDYRDGNGNPGYFQIHHAVYDRDGQPCGRCGAIIKRLTLGGRSSFYCPTCQR